MIFPKILNYKKKNINIIIILNDQNNKLKGSG